MGNPFDIVFWVRAGLGVLGGLLAGVLGFVGSNERSYLGVFVAVALYGLSLGISRMLVVGSVPKSERTKMFIAGLGTFIMLFLFTWILYNTLILGK